MGERALMRTLHLGYYQRTVLRGKKVGLRVERNLDLGCQNFCFLSSCTVH